MSRELKENEMKLDKKTLLVAAIALVIGIGAGWAISGISKKDQTTRQDITPHDHEDETIWTCSMHPQIKMNKPGLCPICAMDLIPLDSESADESSDPNEIQMSEAAIKLARKIGNQKGKKRKQTYNSSFFQSLKSSIF